MADPKVVTVAFDDVAQVAQYAKTYAESGVWNAACRLLDALRAASEQTAVITSGQED